MSFDTGFLSQNSQSSQHSCDSTEFDELFDLDRPPTCSFSSFSLPTGNFPSQLILTKSTQQRSDFDSCFDFTSNSSNRTQRNFRRFETQTTISSQSPVSTNSDNSKESNLESRSSSGLNEYSQNQSNESNESVEHSEEKADREQQFSQKSADDEENVDEEMPLTGSSDQTVLYDMPDSVLPIIDPIIELFRKIRLQYSDNAFVYALASNMCKDIYPKNSHISLKMALLLSIVSCNVEKNAQPISIMAITRDSATASSVMRNMGNCARRFVCINDDLKFNGICTKTKTIEANSLLMARNGVCFIGDWFGLKASSLNYLQNVVDSSRVTADRNSNIEYALNCAIWMYWSCSAKKMSQNQKDLTTISKLFGIPVVLDEIPSQDVIDFLFAQCSSHQTTAEDDDEGNVIDENAIKTYLNIVSGFPTEFDQEALGMLKYYFIVTRAMRPNILTPKSFDILQRLSECHAKLCLRIQVLKIDVTFAIELFEQFVLNVFAGQVLTKPIANSSPTGFQQVDDNMREFTQWLIDYLSNVNESVHTFFQENL
ncbi:minichromosome maintenance domain-containing protein 2 [Contarinia nasturtii]|uniref:minichromosome maintenance domain-containing protein 2 n=1 Tax=Contarinia nasturtii TaxID=265458 RepID=UPI0012D413FF|nr:minichromosome maintenance domain-containing protein 2 [Contarinia nasturtii]